LLQQPGVRFDAVAVTPGLVVMVYNAVVLAAARRPEADGFMPPMQGSAPENSVSAGIEKRREAVPGRHGQEFRRNVSCRLCHSKASKFSI
jgi:hypothetical protein